VTLGAALAIPLLQRGLVEQARAQAVGARARARRLGEPMARLVACWFGALLAVRKQDVEGVATLAEELHAVTDDAALAQGWGPSRWYRGWVQAHQGDPRSGATLIREAYRHNAALGMLSGAPEVLGYAVEALVVAEDWGEAERTLAEAMDIARKLDERVYLPQLRLLRSRIALARGDNDEAREAALAALSESRNQQAFWSELTALIALCELRDARREDFDALAEAYERLSEGQGTELAIRARALVREHAR
jgi:hypothetical protein